MKTTRLIRDRLDKDMIHIYVPKTYTGFGKEKTKWFYTATTHIDLVEDLFDEEIAREISEETDDLEIKVHAEIKNNEN